MPDEVTFIDLACLLRITQDTTLEKLGSSINASIFDASNIAGTLKQKGLIDFTAYYPGPNTIAVTDAGKALIAEAEAKAAEQFDDLDDAILFQLSGGKRSPTDLQNTLNLRPKDLALRLYKLFRQGLVIFELKSGGADLMLTEAGFLKSKSSKIARPQAAQTLPRSEAQAVANSPAGPEEQPQQEMPHGPKKSRKLLYLGILVIVIVVAVAIYYFKAALTKLIGIG